MKERFDLLMNLNLSLFLLPHLVNKVSQLHSLPLIEL